VKNKLILLTGVGVGYVLGTRAGREQYDRIRDQARSLWSDPRVQDQVSSAQATVKEKAPLVQEKVGGATKHAADRVSGSRGDTELNESGGGI
jgi:hypothetical protein